MAEEASSAPSPETACSCGKSRTAIYLATILVTGAIVATVIAVIVYFGRTAERIAENESKVVTSYFRQYYGTQPLIRSGVEPAGEQGQLNTYAAPYTILYDRLDKDGSPFRLISREFRDAYGMKGTPAAGYLFRDLETVAGKPIEIGVNCGLCAMPAKYGVTGRRTFIAIITDHRVWAKDLGAHTRFITDLPAAPKAAGWVEVQED